MKNNKKLDYMKRIFKTILYALVAGVVLFSLTYVIVDYYKTTNYQVGNPASIYCIEQSGELIIEDSIEGQYGICLFEDGTRCEEWDFYNGVCGEGDSIYLTFSEYQAAIDTSCRTVEDCEIKDVRNCCGYFPKCVNKDFEVASPEFVAKRCEIEGLFGSCGFVAFQNCDCVDNNCIAHH